MYNVLIVDDEPIVVEALRKSTVWDDFGLEVIGDAYNGVEALELMEKHHVHLLITDVRMPQMDGIELIRNIHQRGWDVKILILSGHDDFLYVKQAVKLGVDNYMLKPLDKNEFVASISAIVEKLQDTTIRQIGLAEQLNAFRENILLRWVTGSITRAELQEKSQIAQIELNLACYRIGIIKVLSGEDNAQKHRVALMIRDQLAQWFNHETLRLSFCDSSLDVVAIFSETTETSGGSPLLGQLKLFLSEIKARNDLQILITIGYRTTDQLGANLSYQSAKDLQGYSFLLPPNSLINSDDDTKNHSGQEQIPSLPYETINNLILAGRKEECLELTRAALEGLQDASHLPLSQLKNALLELLFQIANTVKKSVVHPQHVPDQFKHLYLRFESSTRFDDLAKLVYDTVALASDLFGDKNGTANATIKPILDYVLQHSNQDLSLKTLAYKFNINASYLGQLFRKETGILFSSYLNHLRIEKAKELLLQTDMKMTDIAAKVGYLEPSHFYKIFKKATGVSPAEFK
ncbi:response regulator transcription factor [Paenibacillus silvisoli]|uniref:response regulator transcription factor n=1 Tax=Paenibacillus silvisoli TaxID=3110539 RepID=UPI002805962A|nr:response regulator [Paenibacillus silvisoli]